MAPPSRSSKTVSEIDTYPPETNSARTSVPASSRRRTRACTNGRTKRQSAISTVPPSMITRPLVKFSPCSLTGGAPACTSSKVGPLLETNASLAAMISSRLNVRFASSTKPLTSCSPADSLILSSLIWDSCITLERASAIVL
eukprot:scaffold91223_cov69-Phaeocystis_antarctica.AAC.1